MTSLAMRPSMISPLEYAPIGRRQITILVLAVLLAALDGYDAMSMAFVAPVISRAWHLDKGILGILLACGLIGMATGSLAISPLADRIGRRPAVLGSLALMVVGSLLSSCATSVALLAASRVLTGIGIGVMIVLTTLISAEFSNQKRRALAVAAIATIGFPIGGVAGGLTAGFLLKTAAWASVFLVGAISGTILLVLMALTLPESPVFLMSRRPANSLARLNRVLSSLGQAEITETPSASSPSASKPQRTAYRDLFGPDRSARTIRLIGVNMLLAMAAYFFINWLPQLIADAGFRPETGSFVSALSGTIGLAGGIILGALAGRLPATRLVALAALGMALGLSLFGVMPPVLGLFIAAASVFGFFVSGTTGVFYGILAESFPPLMRASGMGLVMGLGRIASAMAPALAGWMFAQGLTRAAVCLIFAIGPLLAAVLIVRLRPARASSDAMAI